jgi:uncharacterized membrane protein YdjX (TVP38/TMEM64 family)
VLIATLLAWRYGAQVWALASDEAALEAAVARLGPWGPTALIGINVAQILVAPIPGYVVQAAAGYLYGPLWGGVYGAVGLVAGAMLAMLLARLLGRPLVERMIGAARLARWEKLTFSTGTAVWFLLLLAPTGDLPYFMAGLSHVTFTKILVLTLLIRVPSTFVVAAAGAGILVLSGWQLALLLGGLGLLLFAFLRYQDRLLQAIDRRVDQHIPKREVS